MRGSFSINEELTHGSRNYFITLLVGFIAVMLLLFIITWGISRVPNIEQLSTNEPATDIKVDENKYVDRIKALEKELSLSNDTIKQQTDKVSAVTGLRKSIAAALDSKLKGLGLSLEVDKTTGDIRFGEGLLFEPNKDVVSQMGNQYLDTFIPAYISTILSPDFYGYIDTIIIEGHADDEGTYTANLELAQNRAAAVVKQIINRNLGAAAGINGIEKYLSTSSRSNSKPIIIEGTTDKVKSRRVEFRFLLKEEKIYEDLKKAVGG